MRPVLLVLPFVVACSEYKLGTHDTNNDTNEDTDPDDVETGQEWTNSCDEEAPGARDVVLNDACDIPQQTGTFTPVQEWTLPGHQGFGPPVVGELNDDNQDGVIDATDMPDVCWVQYTGGGIICVNGRNGRIEWESAGNTGYWDGQSGIALGDLDGDAIPEIVAYNGPTTIVVMDNEGNQIWSATTSNTNYYNSYPAVADMDGDGFGEVIAGKDVFSWDGTLLGRGNAGVGAVMNAGGGFSEGAVPAVADWDGDGVLDVITCNAVYRMDGSTMYSNGMLDGNPAIADLDNDGSPEVICASGSNAYTLNHDLTPTGKNYNFASNYVGPIAADDLDGDGFVDFVAAGAGTLIAFRGYDFVQLWQRPIQDFSGAAGAIMYDFENDGYPEVLYADETKVHVFDGYDGTVKLETSDHSSPTTFENPIVADVDNDGEVEILALHATYQNGITCYGDANHSWPAGRQVWNQHGYTISNVNDDLSLPTAQVENWTMYNNYRSGDGGLPPSSWRDASVEVVSVCTEDCPNALQIVVRVLNQGTEPIPRGLPLVVRAGETGPAIATASVPGEIPTGRSSAGLLIEVDPADLAGNDPWVEVDRDEGLFGYLTECDEDNNAVIVEDTCD